MPRSGKLEFFLSISATWTHQLSIFTHSFSCPLNSLSQPPMLNGFTCLPDISGSLWSRLPQNSKVMIAIYAPLRLHLPCAPEAVITKFFMWICCFPTLWLSWKHGLCLIHLHFFTDLHSLSPRTFWLNQSDRPRSNPWGHLCSGVWAKIPFSASPELPALIHRSLEPRPSAWGRVEKRAWDWWRKVLGSSPISSTANWMSHFMSSKNSFVLLVFCFFQLQNDCFCASQVVVRIQWSSILKITCRQVKTQKSNFVHLWILPFSFSTYRHHTFLFPFHPCLTCPQHCYSQKSP